MLSCGTFQKWKYNSQIVYVTSVDTLLCHCATSCHGGAGLKSESSWRSVSYRGVKWPGEGVGVRVFKVSLNAQQDETHLLVLPDLSPAPPWHEVAQWQSKVSTEVTYTIWELYFHFWNVPQDNILLYPSFSNKVIWMGLFVLNTFTVEPL